MVALFVVALASLACLEARLFYLQVLKFDDYRQIVDARRHLELPEGGRGRILDRTGAVLARDDRSFSLEVVLEDFRKDPELPARLARLLNVGVEEIDARVAGIEGRMEAVARRRPERERKAILRRESRTPYPFVKNLAFEQACVVEVNPDRYPGLPVRQELRRVYPEGAVAGHLTGYTGLISDREHRDLPNSRRGLERLDEAIGVEDVNGLWERGRFQEWTIGRGGIEEQYDAHLRGRVGLTLKEKRRNAPAVEVELLAQENGNDVTLTIDLEVQKTALKALGGHVGAVVAMDIRDGSILVMASTPTYDPNVFIPPVDRDLVRWYFSEGNGTPMANRAMSSPYPPGSVFKTTTAMAALTDGRTDPAHETRCTGAFQGRARTLRCWLDIGHGDMGTVEALELSCNVYFYTRGSELGVLPIGRWAYRMGYGSPSGIDLPREFGGKIPLSGTGDIASSVAIGQDTVTITPMQAARAAAFIANGGRLVRPRITTLQEPWVDQNPPVDAAALETVRRGLIAVPRTGTAKGTALKDFKVAGKTGSAQVVLGRPTHGWFAGYWPHDDPKHAIAVVVEFAGHGGAVAAPIAEQVVRAISERIP